MVNCPRCHVQPEIHPEHGNLYTSFCVVCREYYCALCRELPDHFPAWCSDHVAWAAVNIHRTPAYNEVLNNFGILQQRIIDLHMFRDAIGHEEYDHHPHISYAVEEMQRILRILAWTRVIAFIHPNLQLLQSNQFIALEHNLNQLYIQFLHNFQNGGPYDLGAARWIACNSVVQLLSLLSERNEGQFDHAEHIPPRTRWEVSFSQSLSRSVREWTCLPMRPPP